MRHATDNRDQPSAPLKGSWVIDAPSSSHAVTVHHSFWSGKAEVYMDGQRIFYRPSQWIDYGLEHTCLVDDIPVRVKIRHRWFRAFGYELYKDGELLSSPSSI